jgi:hypothetical protein
MTGVNYFALSNPAGFAAGLISSPMFPGAPSLQTLLDLHRQHHVRLARFVRGGAARWGEAAFRRTARRGLAVLTAMLRRLLHLMAMALPLAPLRPRPAPPPPLPRVARARAYRFRLHEQPPERFPRARGPDSVPDTDGFTAALFLSRLDNLAAVWRARHRIARRLARRVRASAQRLSRPALKGPAHARLPRGFAAMLDFLDGALARADTS